MRILLNLLFSIILILTWSEVFAQTTDTQENNTEQKPQQETGSTKDATDQNNASKTESQENKVVTNNQETTKQVTKPVEKQTIPQPTPKEATTTEVVKTESQPKLMSMPLYSSPDRNFIDTRISFIFGDDDFLHKAGETIVDSPLPGFGNRPGYELFFDNLNSARTGRENQFHIVLYKKHKGFIPGLTTEGALVTKYDFSSSRDGNLQDDGTYLLIRYNKSGNSEIAVTMFPVSTDRFRLGYLYDLTWGGASAFTGAYRKLTPGIKFSYKSQKSYLFAGFKTARILTNPPPGTGEGRENETFYGLLGGAGISPSEKLSMEINGGMFQMGENPNSGVQGEVVQLFGVSSRISYMNGMRMGTSADLRLFRSDEAFTKSLLRKPSYKPGTYYMMSVEGNFLMQSLEDPEKYGTTVLQPAYAGAFNFRLRKDFMRAYFTVFSRSVSFILLNVPSYVPYQALSKDLTTSPELFFATGVDYYFPNQHLTIGATAGFQLPASASVDLTATNGVSSIDMGRRTIVIREEGSLSVLPEGKDALPIFGTKLTAKINLSNMMSVVFMALYQYDPNYTTLKTLSNGTAKREFESPNKFGAAIVTSAKF